jgi:hypothetical protein
MPAAMPAEIAADHGAHAGHQHGAVDSDADRHRLGFVLVLILGFMVGEVAVGILAHSLAQSLSHWSRCTLLLVGPRGG